MQDNLILHLEINIMNQVKSEYIHNYTFIIRVLPVDIRCYVVPDVMRRLEQLLQTLTGNLEIKDLLLCFLTK
ncbi:hypothetical protein SAMN05444408_111109 [Chryseobacterium takakiae]|uniref:Uncharacterized protein n=1 Tax=Chryseobacterium takakiae TaxID=1302685 RepID=A0A1M4ZZX6_9FLAO|nr:hypothetical protein SAMN05444408_111109 [Chryseobacterium takakiae]